MRLNTQTMLAICKRDLRSYFGNPTAYLFIIVFVFATAIFAFSLVRFGEDDFFGANKANLDLLSTAFPYILALFVPAVTMATWADERRQGTADLLFTLPAEDHEVVLAKFAAAFATYTVALAFTLSNVVVLAFLGDPDVGLLFATYLGYWLLGAALVAVGMLASALTANLTVAFVVGALFCAVAVLLHKVELLLPGGVVAPLAELGAVRRFASFTRGVVALEDVAYFVGLTAAGLYANTFLLSRRHWVWGSQRPVHGGVRLASIVVGVMSLVLLAGRAVARMDVTAEGLLSLTAQSRAVLERLEADRPVYVQAWVSTDVPPDYIGTRDALIHMLRELGARGGDRLRVAIHEVGPDELYGDEAERADSAFGIKPQRVESVVDGRAVEAEVFLGLAFVCGTRQHTIPFFDRGLPVQFELIRAIGAVAQLERSKVGVFRTEASLFGSFDFQTMRRSNDWDVLAELRTQYEVVEVPATTGAIDTSIDVLVVPMPSTLPQPQLNRVIEYLYDGGRALILDDPFPSFDPNLAPPRPAGADRNPFTSQGMPPPEEKCDVQMLMGALGLRWPKERTLWQDHNPHPEWQFPREVVFLAPASTTAGRPSAFNEQHPVTSGLQEVVLIYPGYFETDVQTAGVAITPLLQTMARTGSHAWNEMVAESFLGLQPLPDNRRRYEPASQRHTLAVHVQGNLRPPVDGEHMRRGEPSTHPFQAIVVSDMDVVSNFLYQIRRQGRLPINLDNVTFVSNCIDYLAGEEAYIELRKLRPRHRTLTALEARTHDHAEQQAAAARAAKDNAQRQIQEAQARLDAQVQAIEQRTDLDRRTKLIMLEQVRGAEQRRFDAQKRGFEAEEEAAVYRSRVTMNRAIAEIKARIRGASVVIPPIPAIALWVIVFLRKAKREREGITASRRRGS